jgi:hypothetical protein
LTGEAGFDRGQVIKWTVYGLLVVNFGYYFVEELYIASHTLRDGGSFLDWTRELATTIDEIGWLGLLLLFEMETYALPDETLEKKRVAWTIHGLRLLCYMMLAHTVFARVSTVQDIEAVELAQEVSSLCEVADQDISFGYNYRYTVIERSNCRDLAQDGRFYFLDSSVVTDTGGYELERKHVWVDLNDAVVWLLVVWAIELAVWLQNRDIAGGRLMTVTFAAKVLYLVLWADAAWWAYTGHWVWAWDQSLWIAGFWAIEKNLSEWREEIREEHVAA